MRKEEKDAGCESLFPVRGGAGQISPHFKVREFACRDGSDPVFVAPRLVEVLEAVRTHFGAPVTVTSGYRTVSYNKTVSGSSAASQHCNGLAADIQVAGVSPAAVADYAGQLLPGTGGIGLYGSFVHIDVRPGPSRWKG